MTIEEIKQINIVDYLYHKGIKPTKQYHNTYWYLSPLHEETNSSFKVDMNTNLWYE
jgi:DNA primase